MSQKEKQTPEDLRASLVDYAVNLDSNTLRYLGGRKEVLAITEYVLEICEDALDFNADEVNRDLLTAEIGQAMKLAPRAKLPKR